MCDSRSATIVEVIGPDGQPARRSVDACIAPLVWALNRAGIATLASCCGHGHQPARVDLRDGRTVLVLTFEQAQAVARLFPDINGRPIQHTP